MPALADSGYDGAGIGILTPVKKAAGNQDLDIGTRTRNALLRDLHSRGERGFALLTHALGRPPAHHRRPRPHHRDNRAALVLTQYEHKYIS